MTAKNENPGRGQRSGRNEALVRARAELGLIIERPVADGRLHRCPALGGRRGSLDGAYRICQDHPANIWAMNYRTGQRVVFYFGGSSGNWSLAGRREFVAKMEEGRHRREADQQRIWAEGAQKAKRIYSEAQPCTGHPYLTTKGVEPVPALRVSGNRMVVPLYDKTGTLMTIQFIDPVGQKRYMKGGRKGGCCLDLVSNDSDKHGPILVAEGLATGLSLSQATNLETLVAFDCQNLKAVALEARWIWPERTIILAADNDCSKPPNVGLQKAKEAALAVRGLLTVPILAAGQACDFNDLHIVRGPEVVRAFVAAAIGMEVSNA